MSSLKGQYPEESGSKLEWCGLRRCGGLVVSVPAARLPVLGSNLGLGPLHSAVAGQQIAL